MAPIKLKQSQNSAAKSVASSTEARTLVRETLRISASLASSPPADSVPPTLSLAGPQARKFGIVEDQFIDSSLRLICSEEIDGRRWNYVAENDLSGRSKNGSIRAVCFQKPQAPIDVSSYIMLLLPIKCLVVRLS